MHCAYEKQILWKCLRRKLQQTVLVLNDKILYMYGGLVCQCVTLVSLSEGSALSRQSKCLQVFSSWIQTANCLN